MSVRLTRLEDALRVYGYVIIADIELGREDDFCDELDTALSKVECAFRFNSKRYGYRGKSRNALSALHKDLPIPCFGVAAGY